MQVSPNLNKQKKSFQIIRQNLLENSNDSQLHFKPVSCFTQTMAIFNLTSVALKCESCTPIAPITFLLTRTPETKKKGQKWKQAN